MHYEGKKKSFGKCIKAQPRMFSFVLESAFCDKKKKTNMLLVPKYFVTVPDDVPEILINLSHP